MKIQRGGWKKIYLFFGVIFFSMGLLGFILNSRLNLPQLARFVIVDNFFDELAEVGLFHSRDDQVVTVANPQLSSAVLISLINTGESGYGVMIDAIYERMTQKARVVHYPVSDGEWLKSPQIMTLINENRFLLGVDSVGTMDNQLSIVFTVSKPMVVNFFKRLVTQSPDLPLFQLGQICSHPNSLYRFTFVNTSVSYTHWMKVIDALLKTWEIMDNQRNNNHFSFIFKKFDNKCEFT